MFKTIYSLLERVKKFIIYGINGIINTAVTYGLFLLISEYIDYRITIGIVYVVGIGISFLLNRKFVFKIKGKFGIFAIIMITMFLVNLTITWILVELFSIEKEWAQLLAILIVFVLGYMLNKKYAFKIDKT